ncbi:MAG TPA: tRNA threonylcarbamoyladenosine dehydratase [Candidatus Competibacter sp.]|nr:tRNA threonylcarbamoyladenosine dehydratase [Candidatus Competibacter sp.]
MPYPQARTEILIGTEGLARLRAAHVLVAGLGGVGGYTAEALGRAGIGRLTLLDHDVVSPSNLNRQLLALHSTLDRPKVEVMAERLRDIDPAIELSMIGEFLRPEAAETLVAAAPYSYIADCIDSIACKAALVAACHRHGVPVISALGAGNCLDVSRVRVAQLSQTQMCPLARELRRRLRELDAPLNYPVIYSDEPRRPPLPHRPAGGDEPGRPRAVNGTISYMPALFGILLAGYIVQRLLGDG